MEHPRHIALLHGGALGDLVLTLSLAGALRRRFDPTHLTLYARVDLSDLGRSVRDVDAIGSLEGMGIHTLFNESGEPDESIEPDGVCIAELSRFDLIVNCLAEAGAAISRRLRALLPGRVMSISTVPREAHRDHITRQWLDDLAIAGLDLPRDTYPCITLPNEKVQAGRQRLAAGDNVHVVLLHPGSGGEEKCWPMDNFKQLADALNNQGAGACFLVGPVELDRYGDTYGAELASHAPVLSDLSLPDAAACIAAADGYVGNDAGMSHLAAALGTPVVALFGPTDPILWKPLGDHVTVCHGDSNNETPFYDVTVEQVNDIVLHTIRHA